MPAPDSCPSVRIAHLYPRRMSIYADRGNLAVLRRRLEWRGLGAQVTEVSSGDALEAGAHDLYYLGGGQDRDQAAVALDLAAAKGEALRAAAADGAAMLFVCGGYQLAGHTYRTAGGDELDGISLLDVHTTPGSGRLVGDALVDADLEGQVRELVGYENHGGRTQLGPGCRPLGTVVHGMGNNGRDHTEGAVSGRVIGTYLHGPLLPRNPWLADLLLRWALEHRTGLPASLRPLDDHLERAAHTAAVARVGIRRRSTRDQFLTAGLARAVHRPLWALRRRHRGGGVSAGPSAA